MRSAPFSALRMVITAPATAPPAESETEPEIEASDCARVAGKTKIVHSMATLAAIRKALSAETANTDFMTTPLESINVLDREKPVPAEKREEELTTAEKGRADRGNSDEVLFARG